MKPALNNRGKRNLSVFVITLMGAALLFAGQAWGISPGLSLSISTGVSKEDPTFLLGSAVPVVMIIKNDTAFPINTKRGFSKKEPHRFLVLIDPQGKHHIVGGVLSSGDAPPPFFLGDKVTIPAESIPANWNKKVTIDNLASLFPVITKNIGWYKLETHLPFVRLVWAIEHPQLGLLGVANDERNFSGTIDSNQVQFHVVLAPDERGAKLKVQLLDQSTDPPTPINQGPVRVYDNVSVEGLTLEQAWAQGPDYADLTGRSNPEGWVIWDDDLCQLQNDYKAIAFYQDEYKEVSFSKEGDTWAEQCKGVIEKTIYFGETPGPPPIVDVKFSIFGLNSVKIGSRAFVLGGDIGVNATASSSASDSGVAVLVESRARLVKGVRIFADSVRIEKKAVVHDVYYNVLENNSQILGKMITPLKLPVWNPPAFLESAPGQQDVTVKGKKNQNVVKLAAGAYGPVKVNSKGKLILLGGTYHFKRLELEKYASLTCQGPVNILIEEGLQSGDKVYIGPALWKGINAADIVLYIGGTEVAIGNQSTVRANVYAPNGTLKIEKDSLVAGSFIAKNVSIDDRTTVIYNSTF